MASRHLHVAGPTSDLGWRHAAREARRRRPPRRLIGLAVPRPRRPTLAVDQPVGLHQLGWCGSRYRSLHPHMHAPGGRSGVRTNARCLSLSRSRRTAGIGARSREPIDVLVGPVVRAALVMGDIGEPGAVRLREPDDDEPASCRPCSRIRSRISSASSPISSIDGCSGGIAQQRAIRTSPRSTCSREDR